MICFKRHSLFQNKFHFICIIACAEHPLDLGFGWTWQLSRHVLIARNPYVRIAVSRLRIPLRKSTKWSVDTIHTVFLQRNYFNRFRNICLCHVCSEIRDIYKKTGAWFYKGLPNYEVPNRVNSDVKSDSREQPAKLAKTTKLGMEIESDEDDEDCVDALKEEQKPTRNGSFGSAFLKSRNLFNLRLSTDSSSRLPVETNSLPKKSPSTPYSRQTSSSDSQKSANSLQPQPNEFENGTPTSGLPRPRRNSISSSYSISEGSTAVEGLVMNQSMYCCWMKVDVWDTWWDLGLESSWALSRNLYSSIQARERIFNSLAVFNSLNKFFQIIVNLESSWVGLKSQSITMNPKTL